SLLDLVDLLLARCGTRRSLHSFPTRRSSDLYLIGQILSVLITRFNLIELNLNYSSLSVIVVIFITIVTVLLSALYPAMMAARAADRKSTRLNSSHVKISYAVFCLKKTNR